MSQHPGTNVHGRRSTRHLLLPWRLSPGTSASLHQRRLLPPVPAAELPFSPERRGVALREAVPAWSPELQRHQCPAQDLLPVAKMKQPSSGPSFSLPQIVDAQSDTAAATIGYTFSLFGKKVIIPEYTPGWVYFLLLMAAGFGLFISEEALNVWVGISLGRTLCLDGTWQAFVNSFSANASYIISTVLWVYWGVCLSDMIPFFLGKLFRQTGASENISSKIGIGKEQALSITRGVQKHGNLIGFVERFSIGVRNPTAFLAGALGISADCFFAGVCCGCLFTLPVQLAVGFVLRERPVVALASVAAAVGIWNMFPYAAAACTALFLYLRRRESST